MDSENTDLKKRIAFCIDSNDPVDAVDILTSSNWAKSIDDDSLASLVGVVLDDDEDNAAPIYPHVIARVEPTLATRLHKALAECSDAEAFYKAMREPASFPYHDDVLEACDLEKKDNDELGETLVELGDKLSQRNKIRIAREIKPRKTPDTDDFIAAIATLGDILDDVALAEVVDKMASDD
jgi:hypothetical protein